MEVDIYFLMGNSQYFSRIKFQKTDFKQFEFNKENFLM